MEKFIKKLLRESLTEANTGDLMGMLSNSSPNMRSVNEVPISPEELNKLKSITWRDISIDDLGGESNVAQLGIKFPFKTNATKGIVVDIQIFNENIFQPHISMSSTLQNIGLGYKIYQALIHDLGHLYSNKKARLNPNINNIWNKLSTDPEIDVYQGKDFTLAMDKNNPIKDEILKKVGL